MMTENEISKIVVHSCFEIHKKLGSGLFESVYEETLFKKNDTQRIINGL